VELSQFCRIILAQRWEHGNLYGLLRVLDRSGDAQPVP
jgi:hypothetical protein